MYFLFRDYTEALQAAENLVMVSGTATRVESTALDPQ